MKMDITKLSLVEVEALVEKMQRFADASVKFEGERLELSFC